MNHELSMAYLAVRLTEQHVRSARPDAPTVPERPDLDRRGADRGGVRLRPSAQATTVRVR